MGEEARQWMEQAKAELKAAKDNIASQNYYLVAFLCHQAIEKALKSIHIAKTQHAPPQTHSLQRLAKDLKLPYRYLGTIDLLAPAYMLSRYPDVSEDIPADIYTSTDANTMLTQTEELFSWIREQLPRS